MTAPAHKMNFCRSVNIIDRERIKHQRACVVWFTGLSGAGKTTVANALEARLHSFGKHTYLLDGDNIRQGLSKDLGFSAVDRAENIRRIAEVASLMVDAGLIVLAAFISPYRRDRELARSLIGSDRFLEVYVDTPLHECERRDIKGLYRQARAGVIRDMTGIQSSYEPPLRPDVRLSGGFSVAEWVDLIQIRLSENITPK